MTAWRGGASQSVSSCWLLWIPALRRCQEEWRSELCWTSPAWLTFCARLFGATLFGELSEQRSQVMLVPGGDPTACSSLENGLLFIYLFLSRWKPFRFCSLNAVTIADLFCYKFLLFFSFQTVVCTVRHFKAGERKLEDCTHFFIEN